MLLEEMERHEARLAFKRIKLKENSVRKNCARKIWESGRVDANRPVLLDMQEHALLFK